MNKSLKEEFLEEQSLIKLCNEAGDHQAFEKLVEPYASRLKSCIRNCGIDNEQDAEEVYQDTLINAWKHLSDFNGNATIYTWLYRIAVNESINLHNKQRCRGKGLHDSFDQEASEDYEGLRKAKDTTAKLYNISPGMFYNDSPEHVLRESECAEKFFYAMERVEKQAHSDDYTRPLIMFLFEDKGGYKEIAEELGVSLPKVRTNINRALDSVADIMAAGSDEDRDYIRGLLRTSRSYNRKTVLNP
jgi:RNA polymerase sigma factor (sigma-70 family)